MTKVQKIWLGVFLAMFLVPEILWGPILGLMSNYGENIILPIFKNSQFIENNVVVMNFILISELVAVIGMGVINFKYCKSNKIVKITSGVIIILVTFYLIFATYLFNSLDSFFS
ncbi:MAG: hypothetical protein WC794_01925 [Candidatus Doudnabacteria bacterium]|jgi:hypothetical protein